MAASSGVAQPIRAYRVTNNANGNAPCKRLLEKATQTFKQGVPVQIEVASGFIIECAAIVSAATALIAGFSTEPGNNLTTNGVAKTLTYGSVINQPNAVLIPVGAPPNDGTIGFETCPDDVTFIGVYGDSSTAANATLAQTQVGAIRGLTKDAGNGFWYVDNFITATANGACVVIQNLISPVGTLNGLVEFKVAHAAQQLLV